MLNHTLGQTMHGLHIPATNEQKSAQEVKQVLLYPLLDVLSTIYFIGTSNVQSYIISPGA